MTSIFEVAYNSLQFVKCIYDDVLSLSTLSLELRMTSSYLANLTTFDGNLIRDLEDDIAKRTAT